MKKIKICFHTVNLLNRVFSLQNKTKVSFNVYDYTLFRKKLKNTNKILESKIQSIVMTFGLFGFLVSGFFCCLTGCRCKITSNIFLILITLGRTLRFLFLLWCHRSGIQFTSILQPQECPQNFVFLWFQPIACIFPSITG